MPGLRAVAISIGVAVAVAAFFVLWWRWPAILGIGIGALLGGLALMTSVPLDRDPAEADAAWRAAAPDLVDEPTGPGPER